MAFADEEQMDYLNRKFMRKNDPEFKESDFNKPEREWGIIKELHALRPFLDRVIVLKDPEESKYACKNCKGRGHTDEVCERCLGTGREKKRKGEDEEQCRECLIKGELDRAYGRKICSVCNGKKGTIVKPDNTKQRTLTGKIICVGPEVNFAAVGMRVMFTNYTGTDFKIEDVEMMYCSEKDLIGQYKQLNQNATTDQIQEITHEELSHLGVDSDNTNVGN